MDDDDFDFDEEVAIEESVTADRARDMARQQGTGGQGDAAELAAFGVDDTRIDDAEYENAREEPAPVEVDARNDGDPNIKTVFIDSLFAAETMGDVTQSDAKRMEKAKYASAFAAAPTEFKNILSNMNGEVPVCDATNCNLQNLENPNVTVREYYTRCTGRLLRVGYDLLTNDHGNVVHGAGLC